MIPWKPINSAPMVELAVWERDEAAAAYEMEAAAYQRRTGRIPDPLATEKLKLLYQRRRDADCQLAAYSRDKYQTHSKEERAYAAFEEEVERVRLGCGISRPAAVAKALASDDGVALYSRYVALVNGD